MRNIIQGVLVAAAIALILLIPNIGGISTWKYLLAAFGLVFWLLGGKRS